MFLDLPDPDPLVRDTDGSGSGSFCHQAKIVLKNIDSYFMTFFFENLEKKNFVDALAVTDENSRIRIRIRIRIH
jgi:hypothetical protein